VFIYKYTSFHSGEAQKLEASRMQEVKSKSIDEQHTDPKRRFCDAAQFIYMRFNFDGTVALFNENSAVA
jgi:hypothetical protein